MSYQPLWPLLVCLFAAPFSAIAQEPSDFPLSVSPLLFDTCPFEQRLDAFTSNGSLFVLSRWSHAVNAPSVLRSLIQWQPAPIQQSARFISQLSTDDEFFQITSPAADFTLNSWSPPTKMQPSPRTHRALVTQFASGDFQTATLALSEWTFSSGFGTLHPLAVFGGSNNFTDPLPYEPLIDALTFQRLPQPRLTSSAADLVDFAPVAEIVVSDRWTHMLVQAGNSLKLLTYDASWTLLRKSVIIPALGTKRGVLMLADYRVSLAADDATGGVWVALSMESPQFMRAIASLINVTITASAKPTALFWVPPPSASAPPTNASVDTHLVSEVTVPGCQAVWSTVYAYSGRVALTGSCMVNSSYSTQHLWVADVQTSSQGAPSVTGVSLVVNRQINWDHRSGLTFAEINDAVFVEHGSKLLVVGSVGFHVSSSGGAESPGDAFASLFDLALNRETVQTRWGTDRHSLASRLLFLPRNSSNSSQAPPPGSVHTAPLSAFPFRVLISATMNGPIESDDTFSRYSFGSLYELRFQDCSAVSSDQCVGPGRTVVELGLDPDCPTDSTKAERVGIIIGATIGALVAVAFLLYVVSRINRALPTHHQRTRRRTRKVQLGQQGDANLISTVDEDLEAAPVLSREPLTEEPAPTASSELEPQPHKTQSQPEAESEEQAHYQEIA